MMNFLDERLICIAVYLACDHVKYVFFVSINIFYSFNLYRIRSLAYKNW